MPDWIPPINCVRTWSTVPETSFNASTPSGATFRVCSANGAWSLPNFDDIGTATGEILDSPRAGHISGNDGQLWKSIAQHPNGVTHALAMAVGSRDGDNVESALDQGADVGQNAVAIQ